MCSGIWQQFLCKYDSQGKDQTLMENSSLVWFGLEPAGVAA